MMTEPASEGDEPTPAILPCRIDDTEMRHLYSTEARSDNGRELHNKSRLFCRDDEVLFGGTGHLPVNERELLPEESAATPLLSSDRDHEGTATADLCEFGTEEAAPRAVLCGGWGERAEFQFTETEPLDAMQGEPGDARDD